MDIRSCLGASDSQSDVPAGALQVIAAEPRGNNDMADTAACMEAGKLVHLPAAPDTIADGLRGASARTSCNSEPQWCSCTRFLQRTSGTGLRLVQDLQHADHANDLKNDGVICLISIDLF